MLQRDIPAEPHHVMQRRHHGHVEAQIELPKPDMGHSGEAAGVRPGLRGIKRARAVVPDLLRARDGPALFREQPIILIDADKFQRPHADALPHVHAVVVALQHLLLFLFAALAAHGGFLILRLAGKIAVVQQVSRQPDGAEHAGDDRPFLSRGQAEGVEVGRGHVRPLHGARPPGKQRRRHGRPDGHGGDGKPYAHAPAPVSAATMRKCRVMRRSHQFPSGVNDTPLPLMACSIWNPPPLQGQASPQ